MGVNASAYQKSIIYGVPFFNINTTVRGGGDFKNIHQPNY